MSERLIKKIKDSLTASRRLMESGIEEKKPVAPVQKPKPETVDMSQDAMKKRDDEYRRKGWIK